MQNTLAVYLIGVIRYFEAGFFSLNLSLLVSNTVYLALCKHMYLTDVAYTFLRDYCGLAHFMILSLGVDLLRIYIPKGFTFAESLSFVAVIANLFAFYLQSAVMQITKTSRFLAGDNAHNIMIFSPVFLGNS